MRRNDDAPGPVARPTGLGDSRKTYRPRIASEATREVRRPAASAARVAPAPVEDATPQHPNRGDRLQAVVAAIEGCGYAGDNKPAVIAYLAATTRVLKMRPGAMPVHLLLRGASSGGKSYTLGIVLSLLPPSAYHLIDAGSPKQLLYDKTDLKHRVVVFSEADSLPAGEDNPAASAVRTLLQEHRVRYKVTVWNPSEHCYETKEIIKQGPTVLLTTAVRALGTQLDTRVLTVDVPDDAKHIQAALKAQAALETQGSGNKPDPHILSHQTFLQNRAPWDVLVPFAGRLSEAIGKANPVPRVLRDFSKLLSLIKAVALLHLEERQREGKGRILAQVEDYAAVFDLVKETYSASVTGAARRVRDVVGAVAKLQGRGEVTMTRLAGHLGVHKGTVSRYVDVGIERGWLTNTEWRRGYRANLVLGEPLPPECSLPDPASLEGRCSVAPLTGGGGPSGLSSRNRG